MAPAYWASVTPGYFEVLRMSIKRGRGLTDRDTAQSPPVVVINETFARQFWKDGDPLNDRLVIGRLIMRQFDKEPDRQIVGIVSDSRDEGLAEAPSAKVFVPQSQVPDAFNALSVEATPLTWLVRTRVPPHTVSEAVATQLQQLSGLPTSDLRSMDDIVSRSTSRAQFNMVLMTTFAVCALVLAAVGVYGLVAYSVQQRTQEIGIRVALGALSNDVRNMVLAQGMRLAIVGVAIGVVAAVALARVISGVLFGVQPHDPAVFVGVPILLSGVALLAVWVPARRAARLNPLVALRHE